MSVLSFLLFFIGPSWFNVLIFVRVLICVVLFSRNLISRVRCDVQFRRQFVCACSSHSLQLVERLRTMWCVRWDWRRHHTGRQVSSVTTADAAGVVAAADVVLFLFFLLCLLLSLLLVQLLRPRCFHRCFCRFWIVVVAVVVAVAAASVTAAVMCCCCFNCCCCC